MISNIGKVIVKELQGFGVIANVLVTGLALTLLFPNWTVRMAFMTAGWLALFLVAWATLAVLARRVWAGNGT